MRYDTRRAARQYLMLLTILLCSLLLVTCLGDDECSPSARDYDSNRNTSPAQTSQSEGRAE